MSKLNMTLRLLIDPKLVSGDLVSGNFHCNKLLVVK